MVYTCHITDITRLCVLIICVNHRRGWVNVVESVSVWVETVYCILKWHIHWRVPCLKIDFQFYLSVEVWFVLVINWIGCPESLESKGAGSFNFKQHSQNTKPWKSVINTCVCNESARYFSLPWRFLSLCFYCSLLRQCINDDCRKAVHRSNAPSLGSWAGSIDRMWARRLEALAVDDAGAGFVVFLLGDPHLLEGGQGGQDGAADPDGVLALGGSNDLQRRRRSNITQKTSLRF